ncbi:BTB/POZ domain-containing protein 3-like [Contarinia nasturtii]|uniref:BTB/POZ domain-containing protein 3-like n=1 Tax=Contarinia nasturtii TaxID=265458 RepID=UPI0012D4538D|nr:BTB/POZ domain-containing protein 3-like [Contarinia nasturtii]XP_031629402.1 BTB/POZ domain-containing protein 3-like [Contarinia nasturtii]XP_031629403.1 BTB/POZ domain-containing protein 3-like [Contarinia nasturtii]XP_031629404.1 BTB/POZ domain-containing protein 3-like [Contarinia nasturtii]XP_031629405.1 BTB/POZ domain-containing protein 3-like [Contarinia nasturtii]XP_031629407.1 BTB/POZ domain-containing protein 3-like [Contarinia nasturtii]
MSNEESGSQEVTKKPRVDAGNENDLPAVNVAITKKVSSNAAAKALEQLYLNPNSADVHFVFGADIEQPTKLPAHKTILAAMSPVFHTIFYGSPKECAEVTIVDAPVEAFEKFLQFFYLADVSLTFEHIEKIMHLCDKYKVMDCMHACSTFLGKNLSVNTVFISYKLGAFYNQDSLVKMCDEFIKFETSAVFKTNDFLTSNKTTLEYILNMGTYNCSITEILEACIRWATKSAQLNELSENYLKQVRDQLGELFFQLPFGALSHTEFSEIFTQYTDLCTNEELKDIIGIAASDAYQPKFFTRKKFWNIGESSGNKVNRIISDSFLVKNIETTTFSSNKFLLLKGFLYANVYTFDKEKWQYFKIDEHFPTSNITIIEKNVDDESQNVNDTILFSGETKLSSHGKNRVDLTSPIIIRPWLKYEIRFEQQQIPPSTYTFSTLKTALCIEPDINIQFYPDRNLNYDNTSTGMVADLLLIEHPTCNSSQLQSGSDQSSQLPMPVNPPPNRNDQPSTSDHAVNQNTLNPVPNPSIRGSLPHFRLRRLQANPRFQNNFQGIQANLQGIQQALQGWIANLQPPGGPANAP